MGPSAWAGNRGSRFPYRTKLHSRVFGSQTNHALKRQADPLVVLARHNDCRTIPLLADAQAICSCAGVGRRTGNSLLSSAHPACEMVA